MNYLYVRVNRFIFYFQIGNHLLFFPLENLSETYKYLMSLPRTFSDTVYICTEINHREVAFSDGLETVHILKADGLDKSRPVGGVFHWLSARKRTVSLLLWH